MRHVVVTAALGGALFLAGAAGAAAWEGSGRPGPRPVADYHDGHRHGSDGGSGGSRHHQGGHHGRGHHESGHGGPRHDHGGYHHGPRFGFYEPPRPRCWIQPTHWGPERVCRW